MEQTWEQSRQLLESDYTEQFTELVNRIEFKDEYRQTALEAITWYTNRLPYHNIEHMFEVTENALRLCDERDIIGLDRQAVCMAALWHDADYEAPLDQTEFATKEHRSAARFLESYFRSFADQSKVSAEVFEFAELVSTLIISTHKDEHPSTVLEEILNEADLSNLQGPIDQVLQKTVLHFLESRLLDGEELVGTVESCFNARIDQFKLYLADAGPYLQGIITAKFADTPLFETLRGSVSQMSFRNIVSRVFGHTGDE